MKEAKIVKESGNFIIKKNGHVLRDIFDKPMVLRFFNQTSNKPFEFHIHKPTLQR